MKSKPRSAPIKREKQVVEFVSASHVLNETQALLIEALLKLQASVVTDNIHHKTYYERSACELIVQAGRYIGIVKEQV